MVSTEMRHAVVHAWRSVTSRRTQIAYGNHSTGPMRAYSNTVALTAPTSCTVNANSAGYFQPRSSRPRMTNASSHGRAAHGPRSTLRRAENSSAYGLSANASIATGTPGPRTPRVRSRYRTPMPAANKRVPSQNRCATHAGMPSSCSVTQ